MMVFQNGATFRGTYIKNERNGPGELIFTNGNHIKAKWQSDLLNGEGTYCVNGQKIDCVWENDVKFELKSFESDRIFLAIFLMILAYGLIGAGLFIFPFAIITLFGCVIFILMMCEACNSKPTNM